MDTIIRLLIGVGGGAISFLFGGWSPLLGILFALVVIDYISGVIASGTEGRISSKVGKRGIGRKILIFAMVSVAHLMDQVTGHHFLRDGVIFFYMANEIISITENVGRAGLPVPDKIAQAIEVLKGKEKKK